MSEILVRPPQYEDSEKFLAASESSTDFHAGLVSPPGDAEGFNEFVSGAVSETDRRFLILCDQHPAGVVNISQIFMKGFCSAYLGYYLFEGYVGKGIMTFGLRFVLREAFEVIGLNRLEANIQPANEPSKRLLKRCGFRKEGFSKDYLKIDGYWRDHERWAILAKDWRKQVD